MSEPSPSLSVVIPLFNGAKTVVRALRSVQIQGDQDLEIVVVDDGSTDGGAEAVLACGDPRVRVVRQPNRGVSAARNLGVAEAGAPWVAFLDADDEWLPGYLAELRRLQSLHSDCDVVATRYLYQQGGRRWEARVPISERRTYADACRLDDYFDLASRGHPPLWSSAICVRKSALEAIAGFPDGVTSGEDLLTWARLAARGRIAYSVRPLAVFHLGDAEAGAGRLRRGPERGDLVGEALESLLSRCPTGARRPMRRYVRHWYFMRTSILLRAPSRPAALSAWWSAVRHGVFHWKVALFALMLLLPSAVVIRMYGRRMPS